MVGCLLVYEWYRSDTKCNIIMYSVLKPQSGRTCRICSVISRYTFIDSWCSEQILLNKDRSEYERAMIPQLADKSSCVMLWLFIDARGANTVNVELLATPSMTPDIDVAQRSSRFAARYYKYHQSFQVATLVISYGFPTALHNQPPLGYEYSPTRIR